MPEANTNTAITKVGDKDKRESLPGYNKKTQHSIPATLL